MGKQHSLLWPSAGCISPEPEDFAVAIQDRVIKTFSGRRGQQKIYKISREYSFNQNIVWVGQKAVLLQTRQIKRKFLGHTP